MRLKDFNETFAEELKDPEFARAYLSAVLEDGDYRAGRYIGLCCVKGSDPGANARMGG